jgi:hydroxypyruvate isomerase
VPDAPRPTDAAPAAEAGEHDEAWWKGRMNQAREELRRSEAFAEALQSQVNALTGDYVNRDDPNQRTKIGEDRQRAITELNRVKQSAEQAKKAIAAIEEEARLASVPPGWIR